MEVMKINKKKVLYYVICAIASAVSLYYIVNARVFREIQRDVGLIEDKYKGMSFEQAVKKVNTWEDCEEYVMSHLRFDASQPTYDPEKAHNTGKAVCFGAANLSKELLSDNKDGYECRLYAFERKDGKVWHVINVVKDKRTGKYGSLGIHSADCIFPGYTSKEKLLNRIQRSYFWEETARIEPEEL